MKHFFNQSLIQSIEIEQAGVELGLTQAETVSLELGLIRAELENFRLKKFSANFSLGKNICFSVINFPKKICTQDFFFENFFWEGGLILLVNFILAKTFF